MKRPLVEPISFEAQGQGLVLVTWTDSSLVVVLGRLHWELAAGVGAASVAAVGVGVDAFEVAACAVGVVA